MVEPAALPGETDKALQLQRMKRIPLLLLCLMAVIFVLTLHSPYTWAAWLHAFAEAGMVGALADWFAVVALFRHPLGLPIPHTAIIPNRKNDIGESMSRFVADHFLEPEVVRKKLQSTNLAIFVVNWLKSDKGRRSVEELSVAVLRWALGALHEKRVRRFLSRLSSKQLANISLAPLLGNTLEWLVRGQRHQQILTQVLRYTIVMVHDNRDAIRDRVQKESPWWLPGFVDDRILKTMLERIEHQLFEMALDQDHKLRGKFNQWVQKLAHELKNNPEYQRMGDDFKQQLLDNDELQDYLYGLWRELAGSIETDIEKPDSVIRQHVGQWLDNVAEELDNDPDMQTWVNAWLVNAITLVVGRNSAQIASLISDTVKSWDGMDTSRRVELAIGRDLQFIRINGTLVGGLVGLLIHAVKLYI
ncbi:MAG: DUF445 domain-containing protein [Xanthomonadales bacterium]|nr:DUF445 domain-containing protein [Xanthomonadales bacterium]